MAEDLLCAEEYAIDSSPVKGDTLLQHWEIGQYEAALQLDLQEILESQLTKEKDETYKTRNHNYIQEIQTHGMEASWRHRICQWMFETGNSFELAVDTVGCAIYHLDQYLSHYSVDKIMLQLLALVCMELASKMHEKHPITMEEMETLSENKFSRQEIIQMERQLLKILKWKLIPPCAFTFAKTLIEGIEISVEERKEISDGVSELLQAVVQEYDSIQFKSSLLGFGAVRVIWNAKRIKPAVVLNKAFKSFNLNTSMEEFVESYRFILQLHNSQTQPFRFISVEEAKMEPSRSISPTCVEESSACLWQSEAEVAHERKRLVREDEEETPLKKHRCQ